MPETPRGFDAQGSLPPVYFLGEFPCLESIKVLLVAPDKNVPNNS